MPHNLRRNTEGTRAVLPGNHKLLLGRGHGEELELELEVATAPGVKRLVVSNMVGLFDQTEADLGL
jgi:hypothetical protein